MDTKIWNCVVLILMTRISPSIQFDFFKEIGSAVSNIQVPNIVHTIGDSYKQLFAYKDPNAVIFQFSPSPGIIQEIDIHDPMSVKRSNYDVNRPTVLISHGFTPDFKFFSGSNTVFGSIANAYFQVGANLNLIAVNWEELARPRGLLKPLHYMAIVDNVPIVGKRVADFVLYLQQNAGLNLDNLHLIGFSLGAHVSGIAGDYIKNMTGQQVHRITGLDPAAPQFYVPTTDASGRLDETDAKFVSAIHTNVKANGLWYPLGNVDFYPNDGGPIQPICATVGLLGYSFIYKLVCSHSQAYQYYAKSIIDLYLACPCDSVTDLLACQEAWDGNDGRCENPIAFGDRCPETASGIYFLRIDDKVAKK